MIVRESILRDLLRLFVWFPLRWLIIILPVRWGIAVLQTMGDIHYKFSRGKKKLLGKNLPLLGDYDAKDKNESQIIREYFRNHYVDHLMIFLFPKLGIREIERFIEIVGLEYLNEALKNGKGVVLVHAHFGPVHLPLVVLARLGYKMKQIGLPSDEGLSWIGRNVAFKLRIKYEARMPTEIIKADSFLRGAFKWLGDNGIIMITGDGSGTEKRLGRYEIFEFFGQQVFFPLGPAILTQKTGANLLPIFITPGENSYLYRIIIERSLISHSEDRDWASNITGQFIKILENYISEYPWYMHFLDRFCIGGLIVNEHNK